MEKLAVGRRFIARSLAELLASEGYVVSPASKVAEAVQLAMSHDFDVAICDVMLPDGSRHVLNHYGVVIVEKPDTSGIPPEIDHLLKDRSSWEESFLPRLRASPERAALPDPLRSMLSDGARDYPVGLHCGSLYGRIRDWTGMVSLAFHGPGGRQGPGSAFRRGALQE